MGRLPSFAMMAVLGVGGLMPGKAEESDLLSVSALAQQQAQVDHAIATGQPLMFVGGPAFLEGEFRRIDPCFALIDPNLVRPFLRGSPEGMRCGMGPQAPICFPPVGVWEGDGELLVDWLGRSDAKGQQRGLLIRVNSLNSGDKRSEASSRGFDVVDCTRRRTIAPAEKDPGEPPGTGRASG
jgi:hypothetical protein